MLSPEAERGSRDVGALPNMSHHVLLDYASSSSAGVLAAPHKRSNVAGADLVAAFRDEQSPRGRVLRGPVCGNAATRGCFRSSIKAPLCSAAVETAAGVSEAGAWIGKRPWLEQARMSVVSPA